MDTIIKDLQARIQSITLRLHEELQGIRSNRPSVGLIEDVVVEAYGQQLKINEVASLSIRPPRDIDVNVWDKGILNVVAKAIETAKAGLSVTTDASGIRVSLPPLTEERRDEMVRLAKKTAEGFRIEVRNSREDANKKLKLLQDQGGFSEDQAFKGKEQIQKVVDSANQKIEQMLEGKLGELSE